MLRAVFDPVQSLLPVVSVFFCLCLSFFYGGVTLPSAFVVQCGTCGVCVCVCGCVNSSLDLAHTPAAATYGTIEGRSRLANHQTHNCNCILLLAAAAQQCQVALVGAAPAARGSRQVSPGGPAYLLPGASPPTPRAPRQGWFGGCRGCGAEAGQCAAARRGAV